MNANARIAGALLSLCLLPAFGCSAIQLKKSADLTPEPKKTLVASYTVRVADEDMSLVDALQNVALGDFGQSSVDDVEALLVEHGFQPHYDKTRTFRGLDVVPRELLQIGGTWAHPETPVVASPTFSADAGTLLFAAHQSSAARDDEYTAFVDIRIEDDVDLGVGPLQLWGHPGVQMSVVVFDPAGKLVFTAKSRGDGDGSPFVVNRSPENLGKAMDKAFVELDKVKVEAL